LVDVPSSDVAQKRAGFVAVVGAANAGKSTLLNQLIGQKISIVTHKAQTTRTCIRGIITEGDAQIVLVDTPGIFLKATTRMDSLMLDAAQQALLEADAILWLVDATRKKHNAYDHIKAQLAQSGKPCFLAFNKIDTLARDSLLPLLATWRDDAVFQDYFLISALNGDGVDTVRKRLAHIMPPSPWLYPEDQITDVPARSLAAEITREQILFAVHEEIPYQLMIETEAWEKKRSGLTIRQAIFVQRPTHRAILLGHKGERLKGIGTRSREEISRALGKKVHLFLHVLVKEDWQERVRGL
jgi:GTPase